MADPLRDAAQALLDAIERKIPANWSKMLAGEMAEVGALLPSDRPVVPSHDLIALASGMVADIEAHGERGVWCTQETADALRAALAAADTSPGSAEAAATPDSGRDVTVAVERGHDHVPALQPLGVDLDPAGGRDVGLGDDLAKRSHTSLCDPMTRAAADGTTTPTPDEVLHEGPTVSVGRAGKSQIVKVFDRPPGTRVRVVVATPASEHLHHDHDDEDDDQQGDEAHP